jgi:hypothetical protein
MTLRINDNGVDRDMTPEEEAAFKKGALLIAKDDEARHAALEAVAAAKLSARTKLKALGLTDDEIAALVGS